MNHDDQLLSDKDYLVAAVLGTIPAFIAGFYIGLYSADMRSLVAECIACAGPVAVLALLAPRCWHLAGISFCIAFHSGFHAFDGIGESFARVIIAPLAIFAGTQPTFHFPQPPEDPAWLYAVAAAAGFTCAALRLNTNTKQQST